MIIVIELGWRNDILMICFLIIHIFIKLGSLEIIECIGIVMILSLDFVSIIELTVRLQILA